MGWLLGSRRFTLAVGLTLALGASAQTGTPADPSVVDAGNRAVALMGQFRFHEAETAFAALAAAHPEEPAFAVNHAIALMNRQQEGDEVRALALFEEILDGHPEQLAARYCAGLLHLRAGEGQRALDYLRQVAEARPADASVHYFLAQAMEQVGAVEPALALYRDVIALDPYLRSAYYGAFMLLRRHGDRNEARTMMRRYQDLSANPRSHLAEFKYTRMGRLAEVTVTGGGTAPPAKSR